MKDYLKNFESLCSGTPYTYSQPRFVDFRQHIESLNYFESIKAVDNTRTKETADVLSLFFCEVLQQPYYYIEALKSYPNDEIKQGQYLYDCIELAKDRFNSPGRGIQRIYDQLEDLFKNDRPAAQRLFEEIQRLSRQLIRKDLNYFSFTILHFNLAGSSLFVELMDFMQYVEKLANRPYIPYTEQKKDNKPLSSKQIALICYYNHKQITKNNKADIAKEYHRNSQGEDLRQDYSYYSSRANRINSEDTPVKTKNKIILIESIIPYIEPKFKQIAIDELKTLASKADHETADY